MTVLETLVPGARDQLAHGADTIFYSMERARGALGIKEPDAGTLELAKRAFAEPQNNGG